VKIYVSSKKENHDILLFLFVLGLSDISLVGELSKYDRRNGLHIISLCGVGPKLKAAGQNYCVNWNYKFDIFLQLFVRDFVSRDAESVYSSLQKLGLYWNLVLNCNVLKLKWRKYPYNIAFV
jgi:hypothetical protein